MSSPTATTIVIYFWLCLFFIWKYALHAECNIYADTEKEMSHLKFYDVGYPY